MRSRSSPLLEAAKRYSSFSTHMKYIIFILFTTIALTGQIQSRDDIEWANLKVSSDNFKRIFWKEEILPSKLNQNEIKKSIEIVKNNFDSIKIRTKLNKLLKITDYRLQFVGGINHNNEKVVFVNCVGKKLPKWIQSNWKTNLIFLKCSQENLITLKLNLFKQNCYEADKGDCE